MGPHKESCGKENKHNPADKSRIAPAFIWTHSACMRLDPNETAACPGWIHHRQIRVIALRPCPSTFNQAPLRSLPISSSPSLEPSASISSCRQVQGAPTEECISKLLLCSLTLLSVMLQSVCREITYTLTQAHHCSCNTFVAWQQYSYPLNLFTFCHLAMKSFTIFYRDFTYKRHTFQILISFFTVMNYVCWSM